MSTIKTRFSAFALIAIATLLASSPAFACATNNKNDNGKGNKSGDDAKVTICHATNSQTNPYVVETVSTSSIDEQNNKLLNGHGDHTGAVWYSGIAAHSWGDIIPAFISPKGAKFAGYNLNEAGKTILNNGCVIKAAVKVSEDKGKPVVVLPVNNKDDHKASASNDAKVVTAAVKSVATGNAVVTTAATELPHTGAANYAGLLGVLGVAAYAITRRLMK